MGAEVASMPFGSSFGFLHGSVVAGVSVSGAEEVAGASTHVAAKAAAAGPTMLDVTAR